MAATAYVPLGTPWFHGAALRPFLVCLVQHVQIRILVSETFQSFMQTTVSVRYLRVYLRVRESRKNVVNERG